MDSLKKKGMKDLIFDLEDNGGGYLQAADKICDILECIMSRIFSED